jgi:gluconokinase
MILLLMGVTGTGKTTIAKEIVARTGWEFAEGDDYHSAANVAKMKAGQPLTDEDRAPWLAALHGVLIGWQAEGKNGVMTCSALKQSYRDTLAKDMDPANFRFVLLEVPEQVLEDRLKHRTGHYMNPHLLKSQLQTLEIPAGAMHVSADRSPAETVAEILDKSGVTR